MTDSKTATAVTAGSEMREGRCMCGAVRFRARLLNHKVGVCHCHMCQRWSSGISTLVAVDPAIEEIGARKMSVFRSSEWGERLFCGECGSSLGWRMQDGSMANISAVSFENQDGFELTMEIYIDEKPNFYSLENDAQKLTGADFLAQLKKQED